MTQIQLASSVEETRKMAETLASRVRCGDVITLAGNLGAGKTCFAQYFIQALSPEAVEVTSPTFNLLQTYPIRLADGSHAECSHYDLYRIEQESALVELGLEDALAGVTLIEWPERLGRYPIPVTLAILIEAMEDGQRRFTFQSEDSRWQ